MKSIIFCTYSLGIGGIEKCLVNLVNQLNSKIFDITIAVMNPNYDFISELNNNIKVIKFEEIFYNTQDSKRIIICNNHGLKKIYELFRYLLYRIAVKTKLYPWKIHKKIKKEYDIAVSYSHIDQVPYYTIEQITAKTKILWYHTLWIDKNAEKYYSRYDRIIAVSNYCKYNFVQAFPHLKEKVFVKYNIYDFNSIQKLSLVPIKELSPKKISILTVARLSKEKGISLAINACEILKKNIDVDFCWYWIGDGPDNERSKELIKEKNIRNNFCLLGNKINPYSYIKNCDIYVQPSQSEAYCTTVIEALYLKKPIIVTNVVSFQEQVENYENALISSNDEKDIANKISTLIYNKNLRDNLSKNCDVTKLPINNIEDYNKFFVET